MRSRFISLITLLALVVACLLVVLWMRSYGTGMSVMIERRGWDFHEICVARGVFAWRTPVRYPSHESRITYRTRTSPPDPLTDRGPLRYDVPLLGVGYGIEPYTNAAVNRLVVPVPLVLALLLVLPACRLPATLAALRRRPPNGRRGFTLLQDTPGA
jgi:hypothetical protein